MVEMTMKYTFSRYANGGETITKTVNRMTALTFQLFKDDNERLTDLWVYATIKNGKVELKIVKDGKYRSKVIL
jgi:hypothetical protein